MSYSEEVIEWLDDATHLHIYEKVQERDSITMKSNPKKEITNKATKDDNKRRMRRKY